MLLGGAFRRILSASKFFGCQMCLFFACENQIKKLENSILMSPFYFCCFSCKETLEIKNFDVKSFACSSLCNFEIVLSLYSGQVWGEGVLKVSSHTSNDRQPVGTANKSIEGVMVKERCKHL